MTQPTDTSHRASLEDRKDLLARLRLPAGQATVERRRQEGGDQLVVKLSPGATPASTPRTFRGHAVRYEPLRASRAF